MPNLAMTSNPSRNGKNASEAATPIPATSLHPGLQSRDLAADHPAHLPRTDAERRLVLGADDGIRFDIFRDAPREQKIVAAPPGLGARFVTTRSSCGRSRCRHRGFAPAGRRRRSCIRAAAPPACADRPTSSTRTSSFVREQRPASWATLGARITSTNCRSRIARAAAAIQIAVEGDDAAERGGRIGAIGVRVGVCERVGQRDAARIRMLHDDARRSLELPHAFERGIAVRDVVVRKLLTLELLACVQPRRRWRADPS